MDLFYEPHRELLQALLEYEVSFIMIGGYVVNYYRYNRPTGDMDIWLEPTEKNKEKLLVLLKKYEFDQESIDYIRSLCG